jgi:hypothetical protein
MKRKIQIVVSATVLAMQLGSPVVAQQPADLEQLSTIATLLNTNDVAGLRAYLEANPVLLEGDSELAALLRRFLAASADMTTFLAFEEDLSEVFSRIGSIETEEEEPPLEEGSDPGEDPSGGDAGEEEDPDGAGDGDDPGDDDSIY